MSATTARMIGPAAKPARHRAILALVRGGVVRTQEDLVAELHRRRFPVAELDVEHTMQRLRNAIREHVLGIEFVDLFGIVHTAPGCAPLVGGALDGSRFEEVAGTIAGDDTVLVIARSRPAAQRLLLRLNSMSEEDA
jgi:arginine repressor